MQKSREVYLSLLAVEKTDTKRFATNGETKARSCHPAQFGCALSQQRLSDGAACLEENGKTANQARSAMMTQNRPGESVLMHTLKS